MHILRHPKHCPRSLQHSVIALGNFDGVHKGHQRVIATASEIATKYSAPLAVMTFEPHPAMVLRSDAVPMRITPFRMKLEHIRALQVDIAYVQHFSRQFAERTAESFIDDILLGALKVRHIVVGEDFNFGRSRGGNAALLTRMAEECGVGVSCVPAVKEGGEVCSSTRIRQMLRAGEIEAAARLLGYDYAITGKVRHGDKRGRLLGFPTANILLPEEQLVLAHGVYAAEISLDAGISWHDAVANFGVRPSVASSGKARLEVHILGFSQDIYGQRVQVRLQHYLRPEQKFASLEALQSQIAQDVQHAKDVLGAYHHA